MFCGPVVQAGHGRDGFCLLMSSGASEARLEGKVLPVLPLEQQQKLGVGALVLEL